MSDVQNSSVPISEAQDGKDSKQSKEERARCLLTEIGGEGDRELVLRIDVKTNVQRY